VTQLRIEHGQRAEAARLQAVERRIALRPVPQLILAIVEEGSPRRLPGRAGRLAGVWGRESRCACPNDRTIAREVQLAACAVSRHAATDMPAGTLECRADFMRFQADVSGAARQLVGGGLRSPGVCVGELIQA
jgi:hypothetical protein